MTSLKVLDSVAHNIGHHATSGLCYVIPHLFRAAVASRDLTPTLNLLAADPLPPNLVPDKPLALSSAALHSTFLSIVQKAGLGEPEILSATLSFTFAPDWPDTPRVVIALSGPNKRHYAGDPAYTCTSRVTSSRGRVYEHVFHSWHFHS